MSEDCGTNETCGAVGPIHYCKCGEGQRCLPTATCTTDGYCACDNDYDCVDRELCRTVNGTKRCVCEMSDTVYTTDSCGPASICGRLNASNTLYSVCFSIHAGGAETDVPARCRSGESIYSYNDISWCRCGSESDDFSQCPVTQTCVNNACESGD